MDPTTLFRILHMKKWAPSPLGFLGFRTSEDRICISQEDQDLKAQAIFSLAGLLKNSDVMLILWDPTWTETWRIFWANASTKTHFFAVT